MRWLISLGLILVQALVAASTGSAEENDKPVKMAVRTDTRPFIWMNKDSGEYLGFYWDICTEAIHRAGYQLETVEIGTAERKSILETGRIDVGGDKLVPPGTATASTTFPETEKVSSGGTEIDFLCDPTTITLLRMKSFPIENGTPVLHFSQIVFVANSSFVKSKPGKDLTKNEARLPEDGTKPTCDCILPWIDHVSAVGRGEPAPEHTCENAWWPEAAPDQANSAAEGGEAGNGNPSGQSQASFWDRFKIDFQFVPATPQQVKTEAPKDYEVWGYVEGSTIGDALNARLNTPPKNQIGAKIICSRNYASHTEAARAFCNGELSRYYGDLDIVQASLADQRNQTRRDCAMDPAPSATGRYEPYAFVISSRTHPGLPEKVDLALYSMFQDGTIERLFAGHFPDTKMSDFLNTLFRINSIPAGTALANDAPDNPASARNQN
ncbi:transporter substrate-binding domain-containing protein [Roseibium album]|uniref:Lysine-arginine-ornithine-binding periplasmic protein n=1 Tax=Roseibium album TaxID=311410 RepID=A0A0M6ZEM6_9HYPH|nr:transporter substrate-binding domain-containing protein [Roseibium album]CTQ60556.1 lysine-arginine-ornithine-binding periplasmic protein [Roseibium album]CTQ65727.1 lysine-arginine-ornithine-binding periplasmic protein [Roseibium album]CTQ73751.1 lysine-arginine-ornithine-binding periplasmic protein [Roseibium album]